MATNYGIIPKIKKIISAKINTIPSNSLIWIRFFNLNQF
ncbi:hypothetical protein B6N60_01640 [Richelia sinica FACHB-800]|uniref:Uncharacterized protein n=1 Tax=Richelia sinica FACHB-800 TaxID=1357546 RepID=A0A975T675_9NOST|nr:hypothetical protein B6N60_01640 [Richelia sinica FACHB-800]